MSKFIAGAILLVFSGGVFAQTLATKVKTFQVQALFGKNRTVTLFDPVHSAINKEPVVLHFWGTWCGPCRKELPALIAFSKDHPDIQIAAVAWMDDVDSLARFISLLPCEAKEHNIFMSVKDEDIMSADAAYYGLGIFPTTIFVSKGGQIAKRIEGTIDWRSTAAADAVKALKEGRPILLEAEK